MVILFRLWHNETWSNYKEWSGWSYLYEEMLQYINVIQFVKYKILILKNGIVEKFY